MLFYILLGLTKLHGQDVFGRSSWYVARYYSIMEVLKLSPLISHNVFVRYSFSSVTYHSLEVDFVASFEMNPSIQFADSSQLEAAVELSISPGILELEKKPSSMPTNGVSGITRAHGVLVSSHPCGSACHRSHNTDAKYCLSGHMGWSRRSKQSL